jgi:spermidine synthase
MFKLPPNDERLSVLEADALDFVLEPAHHHRFDVLQLDLYVATARGPVLDTPEFYRACAACLSMDGCLTVNLFGDHPSFMRNLKALRGAFAQVLCLPEIHDGNVVAIALKQPRALDFTALYQRADAIHAATALPARSWVDGLQTAQAGR